MVMEIGGPLGGTRWTDNSPRPFARAPGAGVGALHESGFAAEPLTIKADDHLVTAKKWAIEVTQQPVLQGQVPSLLLSLRFTDRGLLSKERIDSELLPPLRSAGFKVSKATKFDAVPVTWKMERDAEGDFYFPVVSAPASLAGLRYAGSATMLPWYSSDAAQLQKLPSSVYVYTFAVTSKTNTLTDAEGAQVLSLVRDWKIKDTSNSYMTGRAVLLGSDPSIFPEDGGGKVALTGLALLFAYNMLRAHYKVG